MEKGSAGRILLAILVVAVGAGAVVAYTEMSALRQEMKGLQEKVARMERKGSEPTTAATVAVTPTALPSTDLPSGDAARELAALRERVETVEERLSGDAAPALKTAVPDGAVGEGTSTTDGAAELAKIAASMNEDTKKAITAVMKEYLDQRDRERTAGWTTRSVDRMLDRLAQELALSESQKSLLKPVLEERAKKMTEVFTSGTVDRDNMRTVMDGLRKETDQAIKSHLTAEQAQKYDAVAAQNGGMGWFGGGRVLFDGGGTRGGGQGGTQGGGGR